MTNKPSRSSGPAPPAQWLLKHRPRTPSDIAGHARTIRSIREWLSLMHLHSEQKTKSTTSSTKAGDSSTAAKEATPQSSACPPPIMFLHGPGGVGKTALARAMLKHANYHIYELNSSEVRSKKRIEEIMDKVLNSHSVSMMKKKGTRQTIGIIMDEIDGMSCGDRGGLHELFSIVQRQYNQGYVINPIICISNKPYVKKLPECLYHEIPVRHPSECDIAQRLRHICDAEQVVVDDITLMWIVKYGRRDVRRTIHFLQEAVHYFGNEPGRELTIEDVNVVKQITSQTVADHNLFDVTRAVFGRHQPLDNLHSMYKSDPSMTLVMMHENAHVQLQQKSVPACEDTQMDPYTDVLHHLSLSSMFMTQNTHWELSHAMAAMCCGVVNERIGALPQKYSTAKKIVFTNTLTKSATQTSIMHSLSDVSRRLHIHRTHFPRAVPLVLKHLVDHPKEAVASGLGLSEIEKLVQVHAKWEGVRITPAGASASTSAKTSAKSKPSASSSEDSSSPKSVSSCSSSPHQTPVHVTPRIKKLWKAAFAETGLTRV